MRSGRAAAQSVVRNSGPIQRTLEAAAAATSYMAAKAERDIARRSREEMLVAAAATRAALWGCKQEAKGGAALVGMRLRLWVKSGAAGGRWAKGTVESFTKSGGQHEVLLDGSTAGAQAFTLAKERLQWLGLQGYKDFGESEAEKLQQRSVHAMLDDASAKGGRKRGRSPPPAGAAPVRNKAARTSGGSERGKGASPRACAGRSRTVGRRKAGMPVRFST